MIDREIKAPRSPTMGMDVDGDVRVFLADRAHKERCGFRLQNSSHILDADDMGSNFDDLFDEVHVIF